MSEHRRQSEASEHTEREEGHRLQSERSSMAAPTPSERSSVAGGGGGSPDIRRRALSYP